MEFFQSAITAVYFIFGSLLLFLAYTIIRDNPSNRLNRVTGTMLFFGALGPIFMALGSIVSQTASGDTPFDKSLLYNLSSIWELFFPAFLLFSLAFPVYRLSKVKRRIKYLVFLPYLFHILLVLVFNNPERILNLLEVESGEGFTSLILEPISLILKWVVLGFSLLLSSERTLFSILNLMYVALAIFFINSGKARITNSAQREQSGLIVWGISIAMGLYTIAFLLPDIFLFEINENLRAGILIAALLTGGGSFIYSMVRYQILDVQVIVRQSLVYTISSGILVGLYILLVGQANQLITSTFGEKTTIVNIAFIVAALIFFQPINIQLDNLIKRLFIKTKTDYRNIMEQISRRLVSVFDPTQLRAMIEKTLKSAIQLERIYFILYDDKLKEYAIIPSDDYPKKVIIDREDMFLRGVNQLDSPTLIERLNIYRKGSVLGEEMEKHRVELILPLKDADHLLGFLALSRKASGFRYNIEDITMLGVISNQLVTVLTNARLYADSIEKQRLDEEMAMASQIQKDLLPKHPPRGEDFTICAYSRSSRIIGGDFYDFIETDGNKIGIVIADASGKGLPAALMVAQIQAMLRSEVANNNDISRILSNVNRHVAASTSSGKYATLFYGEYDPVTNEFRYTNAGHNYPILIRANGSHQFLSEGGLIIGAFDEVEYNHKTVKLEENDLIFLYTDGVSEAMNESEEEYGEERIFDFVAGNRHLQADEIMNGLLADVKKFDLTEPPSDDTTVIVLKINKERNSNDR